jgi:hypothetical protein
VVRLAIVTGYRSGRIGQRQQCRDCSVVGVTAEEQ